MQVMQGLIYGSKHTESESIAWAQMRFAYVTRQLYVRSTYVI